MTISQLGIFLYIFPPQIPPFSRCPVPCRPHGIYRRHRQQLQPQEQLGGDVAAFHQAAVDESGVQPEQQHQDGADGEHGRSQAVLSPHALMLDEPGEQHRKEVRADEQGRAHHVDAALRAAQLPYPATGEREERAETVRPGPDGDADDVEKPVLCLNIHVSASKPSC